MPLWMWFAIVKIDFKSKLISSTTVVNFISYGYRKVAYESVDFTRQAFPVYPVEMFQLKEDVRLTCRKAFRGNSYVASYIPPRIHR